MRKLHKNGGFTNLSFLSWINWLEKQIMGEKKWMRFVTLKEGEQALFKRDGFGKVEVYGVEGPGVFGYDTQFTERISITCLGKTIEIVRTSIPEEFAISDDENGRKITSISEKGFAVKAKLRLYIKVTNIVLFEQHIGEKKEIGSVILDEIVRLARKCIEPNDNEDGTGIIIPKDDEIQRRLAQSSQNFDEDMNLYWHPKQRLGFEWAINIIDAELDEKTTERMKVFDVANAGERLVRKLREGGEQESVKREAIRAYYLGSGKNAPQTVNLEQSQGGSQ